MCLERQRRTSSRGLCQEVPGVKSDARSVDGYLMLNAAMLNAVRIVDRGRFALALLIAIPLGVIVAAPSGGKAPSIQPQWAVQYTASAASALEPVAAREVLANLTNGGSGSTGAGAATPGTAHDEIEGEVTSELPATYVPGAPPGADLAAVLRASEARNGAALPRTAQSTATAVATNPNIRFTRQSQINDLVSGQVDPRVVDLLTWIASRRQVTITSMRTDHSTYVAGSSRVSAHSLGRALDIGAVNGQICTGGPDGECGRLYEEIVNQLRGTQYQPSQVIYGYDRWLSEGWNFEMGNHHDHIHIGY